MRMGRLRDGLLVAMIACCALVGAAAAARGRRHAPLPPARPAEAAAADAAEASAPVQEPAQEAISHLAPGAPPPRVLADAPLPPERPAEFGGVPSVADAAQAPNEADYLAYAAPLDEPGAPAAPFVAPDLSGAACLTKLREAGVDFEPAPAPHATLGGCHIPTPVNVSSLPVEGRRIELPAKPLLDCAYVLQFADFAARLAAPLGPQHMRAALVALDTGPGYECRGRNRVAGARVSAHGKGIALDVSGFIFGDGRKVVVAGQRDAASHAYFAALRKGSCRWFTTVLGPGSDGYHESHLHFDTEAHGRHGMHYCH